MRITVLTFCFIALCAFKPVKRYIQKAEYFVEKGNLKAAKDYYLKALEKDSMNPRANYGLGLLYSELLENYSDALPYLERAYDTYTSQDSMYEVYYALAKCYQHNAEYEKAISFYDRLDGVVDYEHELEFPKEIQKRKEECRYAMAHRNDPPDPDIYLVNAGKAINSEMPEYGPVLTSDHRMIFTSKRKDHKREQLSSLDGKYHESMYVADITPTGFAHVNRYALPGKLLRARYANDHQAVVSLSQDGKELFTFRNGGIYEIPTAELEKGKPRKLVTTFSSKYYQNHAFLTRDGNTLYFTSDADGGLGGLDIYKCVKDEKGKWGTPENLGAPINTQFDDDAPYITSDNKTLYFASKGHPGFGNYDLYRSVWTGTAWGAPENLGMPVNSPGHDIFWVEDSTGIVSYFSSGRNGGFGDMDIYRIVHLNKFGRECQPLAAQVVPALINDADSTDFRNSVQLQLPANLKPMSVEWSLNGEPAASGGLGFEHDYKAPGTYTVSYKVIAACDTCLVPLIACNSVVNVLKAIPSPTSPATSTAIASGTAEPGTFDVNTYVGELSTANMEKAGFDVRPIHFGFDKSKPEPASADALNRNAEMLKKYPRLKVLVIGYADSRGPDRYNDILSERRARAVVKYLLNHGVDQSQIIGTEGRGSRELVNKCAKGVRCSEKLHHQNRRVVLHIRAGD